MNAPVKCTLCTLTVFLLFEPKCIGLRRRAYFQLHESCDCCWQETIVCPWASQELLVSCSSLHWWQASVFGYCMHTGIRTQHPDSSSLGWVCVAAMCAPLCHCSFVMLRMGCNSLGESEHKLSWTSISLSEAEQLCSNRTCSHTKSILSEILGSASGEHGMWRRYKCTDTDVLEEWSASIFSVRGLAEQVRKCRSHKALYLLFVSLLAQLTSWPWRWRQYILAKIRKLLPDHTISHLRRLYSALKPCTECASWVHSCAQHIISVYNVTWPA